MKLSIVIVNWNTADLLIQCLRSVFDQSATMDFDVWVVDNGSTDNSIEEVRRLFPGVRLIENEENYGFARANNQAIQQSQGEYLLLLNSDTIVLPGAFDSLLAFMESNPRVGIVGAQLLNADGSIQHSWAKFPTILSEFMGRNFRSRKPYLAADGSESYLVDWVGGACFLVRRKVIEQVGFLDEQYYMYAEEMDLCYRASRKNWHVCYFPLAKVVHLGGQSSKKTALKMKKALYRSKLLFFQKNYGPKKAVLLGRLLQFSYLLKSALGWTLRKLSGDRSELGRSLFHNSFPIIASIDQDLQSLSVKAS